MVVGGRLCRLCAQHVHLRFSRPCSELETEAGYTVLVWEPRGGAQAHGV